MFETQSNINYGNGINLGIDELHEEELIYDVCVYGHVYIIEADNENEAKMIACDTYYEETGLKAYTDDEAVVWKIHGEYPYEWQ